MHFFKKVVQRFAESEPSSSSSVNPPSWTPAPEDSHRQGRFSDASEIEYKAAEEFCKINTPEPPCLLSSYIVERIRNLGGRAWGLERPTLRGFLGAIHGPKGSSSVVKVETRSNCRGTCLMSDLPILAGNYEICGKTGVYYEVKIAKMSGIVAIGTACRPYPEYRFPGWNRLSAGLHLDDCRKFFEDPDGGRDYTRDLEKINPGDVIGCGYEFQTGALFYTYNGRRLPNAFIGIYLPRHHHDVFAAIGVEGKTEFEVNFGGTAFKWTEGNEGTWKIGEHVGGNLGTITGGSGQEDEDPPAYSRT